MIASLSFKTGDLIFFFCAWKSPDRFPTGCGLSLGRAWAGRSLLARLRLQFWKAEAAKSRVLPTAFRPSRAGTTLVRCAALWPCISKSQIYFIIFGTTLFRLLPSRWGTLNYFIFLSDRRNLQRLLALVWHITFLASRNLFMIILIDASLRLFLEWYMLPLILIYFFLYLAWGPLPCMAFMSPIILLLTFNYWYKLQLQVAFHYVLLSWCNISLSCSPLLFPFSCA